MNVVHSIAEAFPFCPAFSTLLHFAHTEVSDRARGTNDHISPQSHISNISSSSITVCACRCFLTVGLQVDHSLGPSRVTDRVAWGGEDEV
ncbi:hypothetical protein E2C01_059778 [Portunus trituberculatus]|uniref:Uncharacterized protein n=1 Tax=Portunus trituberculatus TaxID=210409 RepID=A0A5B7H0A2_PORTR|nr:hypothetical protein [Portunus trituberculatus]